METQELFIDETRNRQGIKRVNKLFIDTIVVFLNTFIFKCKIFSQMFTFMITSHKSESFGVINFVSP